MLSKPFSNQGHLLNKTTVKNIFWLFLEKLVLGTGAFLLSVIFARELGPETFGRYSYLMSLSLLLLPLFSLGMSNVLQREFKQHPNRIEDILATCFVARWTSGLMVSVVAALLLFYLFQFEWQFQLQVILLVANIFNAFEVFQLWFQHRSMNQPLVIWRTSHFLIFACLKLASIYFQHSLMLLVFITALEIITRNLGYPVLYWFSNTFLAGKQAFRGKFDRQLFSAIFKQTRFLIFALLAEKVYLLIDIVMLQFLIGSEEVALYSVAAKLSEVWYFIPQVICIAILPGLLQLHAENRGQFISYLQRLFDAFLLLALAIGLLVYFFASELITLLFTDVYADSAGILQIHIFTCIFMFLRVVASQWLIADKLAQYSFFSHFCGAISNVALNIVLIPLYGAWGAAIATLISYVFSAWFCFFLTEKTRPMAIMMTKAWLLPLRMGRSIWKS